MVIFLIIIVVEALVIVALVVAFFTSGQSLPGISFQSYVRPRCMNLSVLQLGPNSTGISGNRTVEFGCLIWDSRYNVFQRSTALSRVSGLTDWNIGGGPHPMSAVPTFKLPTGYLELYLSGYGCGQHDVAIVSGVPAAFTDYHWEYYYCAVISNTVGNTQAFTVHWSQFKDLSFVPPPIKAMVSSNITVPAGQNGTTTISVTWLGTFRGNLSVGVSNAGGPTGRTYPNESRAGGPITWSVNPTTVSPNSLGEGSTTFYVVTRLCVANGLYCTPRGTYYINVIIQSDVSYCDLCARTPIGLTVFVNVT